MSIIKYKDISYGDKGLELVNISKEDYEALTTAQKQDTTKLYFITNGESVDEVDTELDTSSTNPIANAPVATSINALNSGLTQMQTDLTSLNSSALKVVWYGNASANDLPPKTIAMCASSVTDLPKSSEMTTILTILLDEIPNFRHQLAIVGESATVYTRRMWGGTWSAWKQV